MSRKYCGAIANARYRKARGRSLKERQKALKKALLADQRAIDLFGKDARTAI